VRATARSDPSTLAALLAGVVLAAGCGAPVPVRGDAIVAMRGDVDSWNPYVSDDAASESVLELVYPRLVRETGFGGSASSFEPWLAASWDASDDGLELTFHLRPDARWSDGHAVTCDDVRFTWKAQMDEALAWPGAFLKARIVDVTCRDPRTVAFRFSEAYADQMLDANDDAVVPAAYGAVPFDAWAGTRWEERPVTCGPFKPVSVTAGQEAVIVRDPMWWGAHEVGLDRVVLRVLPDQAAGFLRFLDGDVDLLPKVPPLRAAAVRAEAGFELIELPSLSYTFIGWNVLEPGSYLADRRARGCRGEARCPESEDDITRLQRTKPHAVLADARVRRALTLGIDRGDIVDGVWKGHAVEGSSPIPSALWAHNPSTALRFDPAEAARLLDEAGFTGRDAAGVRTGSGRRLELRVLLNADNATRRDAFDRAATSLARLGVKLVPDAVPRAEFNARARDKAYDAVLSGWSAGTRIEPQSILSLHAALNRGNGLTSWSTPASEELLARASRAATREEARPLWLRWQAVFRDEQPYTILYEERMLTGRGPRLRGDTGPVLDPLQSLHRWRITSLPAAPIR
jgi:peptide/nickel transport system substrate-binding protein